MPNVFKQLLIKQLTTRLGPIHRLPGSLSLFVLGDDNARIYLRYSRIHNRGQAFFGLRQIDLNQLDGHNSFICFFTDDRSPPLFVPHNEFERVIRQSPLASDGQYKVQMIAVGGTHELCLPRVGRFNLDGFGGIDSLVQKVKLKIEPSPSLTHGQVQTLLCAIGHLNGFGVYVPPNNVGTLDWSIASRFHLVERLPTQLAMGSPFTSEVDVIWLQHQDGIVSTLFEVEHTTPVYSGLLRFNDLLLTCDATPRFFVVSNEVRRDLFSRQLQRPTFQRSGLSEITSFL